MTPETIFYPVLCQIVLVILLFGLLGKRKFNAVKTKAVDLKETAMNNKAWPQGVVLVSNNITNQFEVPVLFYVIALVSYVTNSVSLFTVVCAWLFVAARCCHAFVQVSKNVVPMRFRFFLLSVLFVLLMLIDTAIQLIM